MRNFDKIFDRGKRREEDFNRRDRERPKMYKAICDNCGKKCDLPFKPTNDKPVYCSQCFSERGESRPNKRFQEKRTFSSPRRDEGQLEEKIEFLSKKIDKIIDLLTLILEKNSTKKK